MNLAPYRKAYIVPLVTLAAALLREFTGIELDADAQMAIVTLIIVAAVYFVPNEPDGGRL